LSYLETITIIITISITIEGFNNDQDHGCGVVHPFGMHQL